MAYTRGNTPWNKGKKMAEEQKEKLSISHLGMIAWNKGIPMSKESKLKLSNAKKGKPSGRKGKHHTEETKKIMSIKKLNIKRPPFSEKTKIKMSKNSSRFWSGKRHSQEHRKNVSIGMKKIMTDDRRRLMSELTKGEKNHNWKGGVTSENRRIRSEVEFRLWRESVFARDNWTCQKCHRKGLYLHPHHIQNFSQYPELRFAIDNGITLCKDCHKEFHKVYKFRNNNKGQIDDFLNNNNNNL